MHVGDFMKSIMLLILLCMFLPLLFKFSAMLVAQQQQQKKKELLGNRIAQNATFSSSLNCSLFWQRKKKKKLD